jgi:hypothetical protein
VHGIITAKSTTQSAVRAELIGSDTCIAAGLTIKAPAPVFAMCRALIAAGFDPAMPLECYRGDTLALRVRSIGEAACLEINGKGSGFKHRAPVGTAPSIALREARP